jgi:valyl-tRNA synthetase
MEKTYQPTQIEAHWYAEWEKNNYFSPNAPAKPAYTLMIPPPNVTGSLHMGHGFGTTLMDVLVRFHRMEGYNTLWQPGTDHAGIATQMVVERQLLQQGLTRQDLGRETFIKKVWEWKATSGQTITQQLRRLGVSVDWSREKFTMDATMSHAVRHAFIQLYNEGYIYRGTKLVNWDPTLLTAISDLEVVSQEEEGKMWHIRYPLENLSEQVTVATTRPETLLGDVALAVHPADPRYQHLIGKSALLPLTERTIPIIADDFVDPEFGSGIVKITPAHDFNDYAVGQRHKLTPINILTPNAHLNENVPKAYQGLERFAAREQIVKDLEALGLLEKIEKHILKIPRGDRSGVIVEPYLTPQWFMKMDKLAEPALAAVRSGEIRFIPENWSKTYFQWLENIEDWCLSRQLWWGHQIPAWYAADGKIYVGQTEAAVREEYKLPDHIKLTQDTDVLDTWFSSGLWPFATLGWPATTPDLTTFYPTQILVTGFDIIFFWVARMIMLGLKFTQKVPFKEIYITGLIRDAEGQKMSKSKGNIIDPLDLIDGIALNDLLQKRTQGLMQPAMAQKIEKATRQQFPDGIKAYGTDALRFTFCALATHGREIRFDLGRLEGYRNFCNKLWNAARYVLLNTEDKSQSAKGIYSLPDIWILARLQTTIATARDALQNYRFDILAHTLYEFTWNEFCDWYLELSKPILTNSESSPAELLGTRFTLCHVLEQILRLLHPIMPFITEEIWQRITRGPKTSIMLQAYPTIDINLQNSEKEIELEWVKRVIIALRTMRSEMNIPPNKVLNVIFHKGTSLDRARENSYAKLIRTMAKLGDVTWSTPSMTLPEATIAHVGELEILLPIEGLIDRESEMARLNKEIIKSTKDKEKIEAKLHNEQFIAKAPPNVVLNEQQKLQEIDGILVKLEVQMAKIKNI